MNNSMSSRPNVSEWRDLHELEADSNKELTSTQARAVVRRSSRRSAPQDDNGMSFRANEFTNESRNLHGLTSKFAGVVPYIKIRTVLEDSRAVWLTLDDIAIK